MIVFSMTTAKFTIKQKKLIKSAWKGIDRKKAAKALGTSRRTVDNWVVGSQRVSALTALNIEAKIGISAAVMRPDIFLTSP